MCEPAIERSLRNEQKSLRVGASVRETALLIACYSWRHGFVKVHLNWTSGEGLVPVLKTGQDVDRGRGREEALHGGPRHTGIRREGPEGLVPVVEEVVDADEPLEAAPSAGHAGIEHRVAGHLGLRVRLVPRSEEHTSELQSRPHLV